MSAPQWSPMDDDQADLLSLVADPHPIIGADAATAFLAACESDARANGGVVSVNRVRALMAGQNIEHHRYSAMWSAFTGRAKPMRKTTPADGVPLWEPCEGSTSGNDGRPYRTRVWVTQTPAGGSVPDVTVLTPVERRAVVATPPAGPHPRGAG